MERFEIDPSQEVHRWNHTSRQLYLAHKMKDLAAAHQRGEVSTEYYEKQFQSYISLLKGYEPKMQMEQPEDPEVNDYKSTFRENTEW